MMDESVFDSTKTQSRNSSLLPPFTDIVCTATDLEEQQQKQQTSLSPPLSLPLPTSLNSDDLATNTHDEYTQWILTASQKKLQRDTKQQWNSQSTAATTATIKTTATNDMQSKDSNGRDEYNDKADTYIQLGVNKHQISDLLGNESGLDSEIVQRNLQEFDPLNRNSNKTMENSDAKDVVNELAVQQQQQHTRRRHTSLGSSGISMNSGGVCLSQKLPNTPTRLPTPKSSSIHLSSHVPRSGPDTASSLPIPSTKPRRTRHLSSNDGTNSQRRRQFQRQATATNWLDLDTHESTAIPIAPRKQDAQRPASMISSFVAKSSTGAWGSDLLNGKANRQLVDFDPFLSQDPLERRDALKCMNKDETTAIPCQFIAGGPKPSPRHSSTTSSTNPSTTRIPLPINKKSTNSGEEDETTISSSEQIDPPSSSTIKSISRISPPRASKQQKEPEVQQDNMIIQRPSLLTKERPVKGQNSSQCVDVNLISVQGELCVPNYISHSEELDTEQQQQHDTYRHHNHQLPSSTSPSTSPTPQQPLQRRVSSLHERLQELVHDESVWNEITKSTTSDSWPNEDDYMEPLSPSLQQQQQYVATDEQPRERLRPSPTSFNSARTVPAATITNTNMLSTSMPSPSSSSPAPQLLSIPSMRPAMSPPTAFKLYKQHLSPFEQQEILKYSQIYFVGNHLKNKHQATMNQPNNNYGYDDERGDYLIVVKDHLAYRYEVLETMGKGSFGLVVKAFDHRLGTTVAVKLIRNKKRFHAQALVEVKTLEDLMKWDPDDKHNNVRMTDHFYFRNHLCIAFECLSINLYDFIKGNNFQGSSMGLIRRFTIQLLNSLMILHQHHLIHCDLKPENILLKDPTKSTIKVIDFGSSCMENEKVYTYIQSRFYRAPEVILGLDYGMAIDMWSVGCILAELYTGHPLFPGENEQDQLACIMEVLGVPSRDMVEKCSRRKTFFDFYGNPKIMPNSKGKKRKPGTKSLAHTLKCSDSKFVDFIDQCVQWDPEDRVKPEEAFKHGWITRQSQQQS